MADLYSREAGIEAVPTGNARPVTPAAVHGEDPHPLPRGRRRRPPQRATGATIDAATEGPIRDELRLHILNVGQADAIVLELPSGRLAVVDFGHRALLDYLDQLDPGQTRRYAFAALTHAHNDHAACLGDFIARHDERVEQYWFSFVETYGLPSLLQLRAAISGGGRRRGRGRLLVLDEPGVPQTWLIEPGVEVVPFPPATAELVAAPAAGGNSAENNRSLVLLVRYGGCAILLGADAEQVRWERIARQAAAAGISLAADIVKAPHHGAPPPRGMPVGLWPTVIRSSASVVVFSVGRVAGKPDLTTIQAVRTLAAIRCTGRSLTCRLLTQAGGAGATRRESARGRHSQSGTGKRSDLTRLGGLVGGSLIDDALRLAPEAATAAPTCFGTQIYICSASGGVTSARCEVPTFLDACVALDVALEGDNHPGVT